MSDHKLERADGEEFEHFATRALEHIDRRFNTMSTVESGLAADVATLATVIPELATELGAMQQTLTDKEAALAATVVEKEAAVAAAAADSAALATAQTELATAQAELAAIKTTAGELTPLVEKAQGLVTPAAGGTGQPPAPLAPPADQGPGGTVPGSTM